MVVETFITEGYVIGEDLNIDRVAQVNTALNPNDNVYTVRLYGRDGELIQERQVAANLADLNAVTTVSEDDILHGDTEPGLRTPYMTLDGDRVNYYGEDDNLLWSVDSTGMYVQDTSSTEYHSALNMRDFLDEIFLKGEWKIPEEEEQPDIQEKRDGALDEFLEKFTPQKTTPERSDEQE